MPTFKHTPFISGRLTSAGETGLRARWETRQPRRTWFCVAAVQGLVLNRLLRAGVGNVPGGLRRGERRADGRMNERSNSEGKMGSAIGSRKSISLGVVTGVLDGWL